MTQNSSSMRRPRIALTVGDPAGIGPEIVEAVADARIRAVCEPVVFAPPPLKVRVGEVSAVAAAHDTIVRAVEAAKSGEVDAIATAPANKLAFAQAGLPWKSHTDLLAHLCGTPRVAMMFHAPELKVVLMTMHVPLRDVPSITRELVDRTIAITSRPLPKVRPHPPATGDCRAQSACRRGWRPRRRRRWRVGASRRRGASAGRGRQRTVCRRHRVRAGVEGEFDCVPRVARPGLIPVKLLAFGHAVNVTIGLPIIRTSVDHGTAFDIAGKGVADPGSMIEAVMLAARMAAHSPPEAAKIKWRRRRKTTPRRQTSRRCRQPKARLSHPRNLRSRHRAPGHRSEGHQEGQANLRDSYARVDKGEVWLFNVHINPYSHRGYVDYDPKRNTACCCTNMRSGS